MSVYIIPVVHVFETDDDPTAVFERFASTLPKSAEFVGSPLLGTAEHLNANWDVRVYYGEASTLLETYAEAAMRSDVEPETNGHDEDLA